MSPRFFGRPGGNRSSFRGSEFRGRDAVPASKEPPPESPPLAAASRGRRAGRQLRPGGRGRGGGQGLGCGLLGGAIARILGEGFYEDRRRPEGLSPAASFRVAVSGRGCQRQCFFAGCVFTSQLGECQDNLDLVRGDRGSEQRGTCAEPTLARTGS